MRRCAGTASRREIIDCCEVDSIQLLGRQSPGKGVASPCLRCVAAGQPVLSGYCCCPSSDCWSSAWARWLPRVMNIGSHNRPVPAKLRFPRSGRTHRSWRGGPMPSPVLLGSQPLSPRSPRQRVPWSVIAGCSLRPAPQQDLQLPGPQQDQHPAPQQDQHALRRGPTRRRPLLNPEPLPHLPRRAQGPARNPKAWRP